MSCTDAWADELFELTDALLCAEGAVSSLVGLCLVPEHRRGHGALYDALNCASHTGADTDDLAAEVIRCGQAYLRRFDEEHTIRFWTQALGWTRPKVRCPAAADRWTWLIVAAHTQLRPARHLVLRRSGS